MWYRFIHVSLLISGVTHEVGFGCFDLKYSLWALWTVRFIYFCGRKKCGCNCNKLCIERVFYVVLSLCGVWCEHFVTVIVKYLFEKIYAQIEGTYVEDYYEESLTEGAWTLRCNGEAWSIWSRRSLERSPYSQINWFRET